MLTINEAPRTYDYHAVPIFLNQSLVSFVEGNQMKRMIDYQMFVVTVIDWSFNIN